MNMHAIVAAVTERIIKRSQKPRQEYLNLIAEEAQRLQQQPARHGISC
ncbi:MAG: hypothetical protein ACJAZ6_001398, partial [Oleispira sp.]